MSESLSVEQNRYQLTQRVTLVGAVINILLSVSKIGLGYIGQSQSLIADGLHSLSDLLSDAVVLFAAHEGSRKADSKHPYGHARIETAATVFMGGLLVAIALGVLWDAVRRLMSPELLMNPGWMAFMVAVLSIIAKEWLYRYTMQVAKQLRSALLKANAWHHRSDSISTVIVLIGIGGSLLGVTWLDAVGAMGVALMIGHVGGELIWKGMNELVDTGLDEEQLNELRDSINQVEGVRSLHALRTRKMGEEVLVDVHLLVRPELSVSEGHQIGSRVRKQLIHAFDHVADVMVHIDPEDDSQDSQWGRAKNPNLHLPLRTEMQDRIQQAWKELIQHEQIQRLDLHYLHGKISIDVFLPLDCVPDKQQASKLCQDLQQALRDEACVERIRVHFSA